MATPTKPTILFVHGAWHPSSTWDSLRAELEPEYSTQAVQLPSVGNGDVTHFEDAAHIQKSLLELSDVGKDVIVVTHAYGGIAGAEAAQGFLKRDRSGKGGIVAMVYITSWTVAIGESLATKIGGQAMAGLKADSEGCVDTPARLPTAELFYTDLPAEVGREKVARLKKQSLAALTSRLSYAPYGEIPATYLRCTRDNAIPPPMQDLLIKDAGAKGHLKVVECDSSHTPMLSMPKLCRDVIVDMANTVASL